jgi:hypothetical protein
MSILVIRERLAAILAAMPEIRGSDGYPPDSVGALPFGFCGLNDELIDHTAGLEVADHTLQVIVLVERTPGLLGSALQRIEAISEAFKTVMRGQTGLPDNGVRTVNFCAIQRIQQDTVRIGDVPYVGFIATLGIHHKYGVELI